MVNEHTASAGEMVAAFAEENSLATIVGTKTPGRLLTGGAFKVSHGYILGLPVAGYLTWQGRILENNAIFRPFLLTYRERRCGKEGTRNWKSGRDPEKYVASNNPDLVKRCEGYFSILWVSRNRSLARTLIHCT